MLLEEIVQTGELEDRNLECKARLDREDVVGWLKSVAGFANADGGIFYFGTEDKTHRLLGFTRRDADSERNFFNNQVNEHLSPRPEYQISFLPYTVRGQERCIIKVTIPASKIKPVIMKYKGIPSIYMRREGYTNGATYEEIIQMSTQSHHAQYDEIPSTEIYKREDFSDLLSFYSERNHGKKLTDKALQSLGFFDQHHLLKNGALLFRDDCQDRKTLVQCSVFSGKTKGSDRIVTINRFTGNLLRSIHFMIEFVRQRMNHSMIKLDNTRINVDAYPARALFEGIVNAIAHRDYYLDGTQIQLDMFQDRLELTSPGSFFQGHPLPKTYELSSVISKRRNELICGVLVKCNAMEAAGTGFEKIIEDYSDADDAHRPSIFSTSDQFTLILPDLTYTSGIASDLVSLEFVPVANGSEYDAAILSYCYRYARKAGEIAAHLSLSNSSYFRGKILENLVTQHYLIKGKNGKAHIYKTNPDMVRPS